jgi:hypothetical protein
MKIISIEPFSGEIITVEEEGRSVTYERYSPQGWSRWYGDSTETVYDCAALEALYQEAKSK